MMMTRFAPATDMMLRALTATARGIAASVWSWTSPRRTKTNLKPKVAVAEGCHKLVRSVPRGTFGLDGGPSKLRLGGAFLWTYPCGTRRGPSFARLDSRGGFPHVVRGRGNFKSGGPFDCPSASLGASAKQGRLPCPLTRPMSRKCGETWGTPGACGMHRSLVRTGHPRRWIT
jgi:hypothetical protein